MKYFVSVIVMIAIFSAMASCKSGSNAEDQKTSANPKSIIKSSPPKMHSFASKKPLNK